MKNRITLQKVSLFLLILQIIFPFLLLFDFVIYRIKFLSWLSYLITIIWCYFSEYLAIPVGILGAALEVICVIRSKSTKRIPLIFAHLIVGYLVWFWFQACMSV